MCLIIACPPGKTPDLDVIIDATIENPDGSGWCMRVNGGMEMVRSAQSVDHVIGSFMQARERWPGAWAVWHSRLATQGDLVDENTHPFVVTGKPWMLVHNGIMPLSDGPRIGGRGGRSDSRIFAEDHISEYAWEELHQDKAELEEWLGYNKVVILSERKEKYGPCLILNEKKGQWDWEDGCWYSHSVDKTICNACGKRSVRCVCPSQYSYKHYTRVPTIGTWEDENDWPITGTTTLAPPPARTEEEDLDDYEEWWAKQEVGVGDVEHTGDIDCECLMCEEARYWEEKERDDEVDVTEFYARSSVLSNEELSAIDR